MPPQYPELLLAYSIDHMVSIFQLSLSYFMRAEAISAPMQILLTLCMTHTRNLVNKWQDYYIVK